MTRPAAAAPATRWLRILAIALATLILASCRPVAARAADGPSTRAPTESGPIVRAGLEAPCPPLPRLPRGCRACRPDRACATCRDAACAPACPACPVAPCPPPVPPPAVGPYLVCDGGDALAPARPRGATGLANLTAGDTVARYRPADDADDADEVRIVESNCACVFAPRFGGVRQVVRPLDAAAPLGPRGIVRDASVALEVERQPVWRSTQRQAPEAARKALPGVAVEERLGPLAVDQEDPPVTEQAAVGPAARLAIEQVELGRRRQRPVIAVGFDVPIAWTCIRAANVLLDGRAADVVAADRGTATLRFEEPGRAELTLCKRAGSDTARSGEELDFTIVMLNSGDRPLAGIVLADALPTRLELVPGSAAASLPADFATTTGDDGSTVLTWRLQETLPPGASGFVRFRALVR